MGVEAIQDRLLRMDETLNATHEMVKAVKGAE